ncbi:DUF1801 domain-containing protein [Candidatus Nomurabacteria bacterium]|nr:DUF1801 domain-containing protein [Candidatus Nomurabacteria bacterium]
MENPLSIINFAEPWQKELAKQVVELSIRIIPEGKWEKKWGMPYLVVNGKNLLGIWSARNWTTVFIMGGASFESKIFEPGDRKKDATIHLKEGFQDWDELKRVIKLTLSND